MPSSTFSYSLISSSTDRASKVSRSASSSLDIENEARREILSEEVQRHSSARANRPCSHLLVIVLSILNIIVFITTATTFFTWRSQTSQLNADLRKSSTYSPFHDILDLEMRPRTIQGTLFPAKEGASIARELPNPAADEIWDEWELSRFFPLTREDIIKLGKDPFTVPKLEDKYWGLGDDAYVGAFDVYHQIHCLNSLRKNAYRGYYNLTTRDHKVMRLPEVHINHCVDILLQALQCSGNVNFMTYHWVSGQEYPQPDMSINRQCINFDKLTAWRKEHGLDLDKYVGIMKKSLNPGVKERHQSDAYYKYYNETNPNHVNGANPDEDFNL
ncbi:hypothetical protein F5B20DRAFT_418565 [Whalleya microplaca]|nr:hypothetical protein F5B20DRAFT_418565 [Whalleya microplaca]